MSKNSPSSAQQTLRQQAVTHHHEERTLAEQVGEQYIDDTSCSVTQYIPPSSSNIGRSKNSYRASQKNLALIQVQGINLASAENLKKSKINSLSNLLLHNLEKTNKEDIQSKRYLTKATIPKSTNDIASKSRQLQPNLHDLYSEVKHTIQASDNMNIFDDQNHQPSKISKLKVSKTPHKRKNSHFQQSVKLQDKSVCESTHSNLKPVSASSHMFSKKLKAPEQQLEVEADKEEFESRFDTKQLSSHQFKQAYNSDVVVLKSNQIGSGENSPHQLKNHQNLANQGEDKSLQNNQVMSRTNVVKSALNDSNNSNLSSYDKHIRTTTDNQLMCIGQRSGMATTKQPRNHFQHNSLVDKSGVKTSKDSLRMLKGGSSFSNRSKHNKHSQYVMSPPTKQNGTNINLDLSNEEEKSNQLGTLLLTQYHYNNLANSNSLAAIKPLNYNVSIKNLELLVAGNETPKEHRKSFPSYSKQVSQHRHSSSMNAPQWQQLTTFKQINGGSRLKLLNSSQEKEVLKSGEAVIQPETKVFKPTNHHGTYFSVPESDQAPQPTSTINQLMIQSSSNFAQKDSRKASTAWHQQRKYKKMFEKEFFKLSKQISMQSSSFYLRNVEKHSKISTLSNSQKYNEGAQAWGNSQLPTEENRKDQAAADQFLEDLIKQDKNILIEMDNTNQKKKYNQSQNEQFFLQTSEGAAVQKAKNIKRPSGTYLRIHDFKTHSLSSESESKISARKKDQNELLEPLSGSNPNNYEDTQNNIHQEGQDFSNANYNLTPKLHIIQFKESKLSDDKKINRKTSANAGSLNDKGSRKTLAESINRLSAKQKKSSLKLDNQKLSARNMSELDEFSNNNQVNWNIKEVLKSQLMEVPKEINLLVKEQKKSFTKRVLLSNRDLIDGIKRNPQRYFMSQRNSEMFSTGCPPKTNIQFDSTTSSQFCANQQSSREDTIIQASRPNLKNRPNTSNIRRRVPEQDKHMSTYQKTVETRYKQREALFLNRHNQNQYLRGLANRGPILMQDGKDQKKNKILKNSLSSTANQFMIQAPLKHFNQEINSDVQSQAFKASSNNCCSLRGLGRKTKNLFQQAQSEIDHSVGGVKTLAAQSPRISNNLQRPVSNYIPNSSEMTSNNTKLLNFNKDSTLAKQNQISVMESFQAQNKHAKPILRSSKNLILTDKQHKQTSKDPRNLDSIVFRQSKSFKNIQDIRKLSEGMPENSILKITGNKQFEEDFIEMNKNIYFGVTVDTKGKPVKIAGIAPQSAYAIQPILDYNKNLNGSMPSNALELITSRDAHRNDLKMGSPRLGSTQQDGTQELKQLDSDAESEGYQVQKPLVPQSIMINNPQIKKVRMSTRNPNRTTTLVKFKQMAKSKQLKKQQPAEFQKKNNFGAKQEKINFIANFSLHQNPSYNGSPQQKHILIESVLPHPQEQQKSPKPKQEYDESDMSANNRPLRSMRYNQNSKQIHNPALYSLKARGSLNTLKNSKKSEEMNNDISSPEKTDFSSPPKDPVLIQRSEESANFPSVGGDEVVMQGPSRSLTVDN